MTRRALGGLVVWLIIMSPVFLVVAPAAAFDPANDAFQRNWARYDEPVANGSVQRTWMWGPEAFTLALDEPYTESPNGVRVVQYFDKARMEITNPGGDPESDWYVTNGLLPVEMITGRAQVGDFEFEELEPAHFNVAGDGDGLTGPTYSTFSTLLDASPTPTGTVIARRLERDGEVTEDGSLGQHSVVVSQIEEATQHGVAAPFTQGIASDLTARGYPITEAYWATVKVAGTPRDVLIQCFERRCLTYTPGNPDGWQVETGNIGQHYYWWRHGEILDGTIMFDTPWIPSVPNPGTWLIDADGSDARPFVDPQGEPVSATGDWSPSGEMIVVSGAVPDPTPPPPCEYCGPEPGYFDLDLWVVNGDGSGLRRVTHYADGETTSDQSLIEQATGPKWSPDGTRIAFRRSYHGTNGIYTIKPDGSDLQLVREGMNGSPTWSPDATRIAFIDYGTEEEGFQRSIWIVNADGTNLTHVIDCAPGVFSVSSLSWSPDGELLLYEEEHGIVTVGIDGVGRRVLVPSVSDAWAVTPVWSPDGQHIAMARSVRDGFTLLYRYLWVMQNDGQHLRQLSNMPATGIGDWTSREWP